jgi:hypothetical protein
LLMLEKMLVSTESDATLPEVSNTHPAWMLSLSSAEGVNYYGIHSEHLDWVWDDVSPMIEKSLRYFDDRVGIDDVYMSLKARDSQLWVVAKAGEIVAAVVTSIQAYPKKKILSITYVGGRDFKSWASGIEILKQFAKEHGCCAIEINARPGWARLLKEFRTLNITQVLDI